jgi:hypothetical protein
MNACHTDTGCVGSPKGPGWSRLPRLATHRQAFRIVILAFSLGYHNIAVAGPCEDIGAILDAGLGEQAAVDTIQLLQPSFTPVDYACLAARAAPQAVLRAAAPLVREPTPAPTPAPAAPARPAPVQGPAALPSSPGARLDPALVRAELLRMQAEVPDGAVAVGLAASVGFGSGHFYAGSGPAGAAFFAADALAMGLILGASQAAKPSSGVMVSGVVLGTVSRLLQPATAGLTAKRRRVEWLERGEAQQ